MSKPMTYSEKLVGRRCPKSPKHMDTYLAGYVIDPEESRFGGKFTPTESWLRSPHKKARQQGLIRLLDKWSIMGSRPMERWHLTEKGKDLALQSSILL